MHILLAGAAACFWQCSCIFSWFPKTCFQERFFDMHPPHFVYFSFKMVAIWRAYSSMSHQWHAFQAQQAGNHLGCFGRHFSTACIPAFSASIRVDVFIKVSKVILPTGRVFINVQFIHPGFRCHAFPLVICAQLDRLLLCSASAPRGSIGRVDRAWCAPAVHESNVKGVFGKNAALETLRVVATVSNGFFGLFSELSLNFFKFQNATICYVGSLSKVSATTGSTPWFYADTQEPSFSNRASFVAAGALLAATTVSVGSPICSSRYRPSVWCNFQGRQAQIAKNVVAWARFNETVHRWSLRSVNSGMLRHQKHRQPQPKQKRSWAESGGFNNLGLFKMMFIVSYFPSI